MKRWITIVITLSLAVAGCAPQVSVQRMDGVDRPVQKGDLPIYASLEDVDKEFKKIARLSIDDKRSVRRDESEVLEILTDKAKALGADALVVLSRKMITRRSPNPMGGGEIVYHYPHIDAAAIVFQP
jgi:hypothetical protein